MFSNGRMLIAYPESDAELLLYPLAILVPQVGGYEVPDLNKRMHSDFSKKTIVI